MYVQNNIVPPKTLLPLGSMYFTGARSGAKPRVVLRLRDDRPQRRREPLLKCRQFIAARSGVRPRRRLQRGVRRSDFGPPRWEHLQLVLGQRHEVECRVVQKLDLAVAQAAPEFKLAGWCDCNRWWKAV